jgi:hypothetical protein
MFVLVWILGINLYMKLFIAIGKLNGYEIFYFRLVCNSFILLALSKFVFENWPMTEFEKETGLKAIGYETLFILWQ